MKFYNLAPRSGESRLNVFGRVVKGGVGQFWRNIMLLNGNESNECDCYLCEKKRAYNKRWGYDWKYFAIPLLTAILITGGALWIATLVTKN